MFQVVETEDWFSRGRHPTGGGCGCLIGVSDIERALPLYSGILGYDRIVYDETGEFDDLGPLPGGNEKFRRMLLDSSEERKGAFSRWLGSSRLELIQSLSRQGKRIFEGRS